MKTTQKLISVAIIMLLITGLCGCSKKEKEMEDTLNKLKDAAWLREKYEEKGTEITVEPYWIQFEGANHYTSPLSTGTYTFDPKTGKLLFKGDKTEYTVTTVTGDKMVWEHGVKRETFKKIPKADPKLLIANGKWWKNKEAQIYKNGKWEAQPGLVPLRVQFKDETSGKKQVDSNPISDFTYTLKGNVLTLSFSGEISLITELTEKKLEYMTRSKTPTTYSKMIFEIIP